MEDISKSTFTIFYTEHLVDKEFNCHMSKFHNHLEEAKS